MDQQPKNPYAPPEGRVDDVLPAGEVLPAPRATRLGATVLDLLPFGAFAIVSGWSDTFPALPDFNSLSTNGLFLLSVAALFLTALLIANCLLLQRSGQTVGKKMLGIKVVRSDGSRASLVRLLLARFLPVCLLSLIPLAGRYLLLLDSVMIFRDSRKCLHDDLADTVVIMA